jgi:hypothetical protein
MKEILKHILIAIGVGFLNIVFQGLVGSNYIITFLKQNLITIILALMAINTTTLGIVLTKIRELIDKKGTDTFTKSKKQMFISINEQIILVIIASILFILSDSPIVYTNINIKLLIDVGCISVFIYDLLILYDTSKSIFIVIDFKNKE